MGVTVSPGGRPPYSQSPELIHAHIEAEIARVRELGFDAKNCLIAAGEAVEAEIEAALRDGRFTCVLTKRRGRRRLVPDGGRHLALAGLDSA